jgi:hypothetical protein
LQAAITAQAYAVKQGTKTDAVKKVNISQNIRRTFDANRLYKRIILNKGGNAYDVFKDLSALDFVLNAEFRAKNA